MPISIERVDGIFPSILEAVQEFVDMHPDKATAYSLTSDRRDQPQTKSGINVSYRTDDSECVLGFAVLLHDSLPDNARSPDIRIQPISYRFYPDHPYSYGAIPPHTFYQILPPSSSRDELIGSFRLALTNATVIANMASLKDAKEIAEQANEGHCYEKNGISVLGILLQEADQKLLDALCN